MKVKWFYALSKTVSMQKNAAIKKKICRKNDSKYVYIWKQMFCNQHKSTSGNILWIWFVILCKKLKKM